MPDVFLPEKRSQVMSLIRGRGNFSTELGLVRLFRQHGITGWCRHAPVFGRPDFVFRKERLVVFVDGCFWHQCPQHSRIPVNNRIFWKRKLGKNVQRDRLVTKELRAKGWRVLRVWEHQLKKSSQKKCHHRILSLLKVAR